MGSIKEIMKGDNINISNDNVAQLPLVSICSITYNHAPYIRQCLDGFLMQKTNFKYEIIIHDDASTDGTAEIIKEYVEKHPDLITPVFQTENQYSKGLRGFYTKFVYPRAKGKYIALCEGDDYWTDPLKLQKQVDFLEANPDYVLCSTRFTIYSQYNQSMSEELLPIIGNDDDLTYLLDDYILDKIWYTQPLTSMFRKIERVFDAHKACSYSKDATLFYLLLKEGKGMLLKDVMGVYRDHAGGIWTAVSNLDKILGGLKTIKGLYDFDHSNESANYLYNYMFSKGYLGSDFWIKECRLYFNILFNIIISKLGWLSGLKLFARNANAFASLKHVLLNKFYSN